MRKKGKEEADSWWSLLSFLFLISGTTVAGDSLGTDREVLLSLKSYLETINLVNRGHYSSWNQQSSKPCSWRGIICNSNNSSVTGINLSDSNINGEIFGNFSALTSLTHLDLSENTLSGSIPNDLYRCQRLRYLNLSHNIMEGHLDLTGLINLETLDLSVNRFCGEIQLGFPAVCSSLVVANLSANNLTGRIDECFQNCSNLQHLDLSSNNISGDLWIGLGRLLTFSVSENKLSGAVSPLVFTSNCSLTVLDLSENLFNGEFPGKISNCKNLKVLNLWGNNFTGQIPAEIGWIPSLQDLLLGSNNFSREIPPSLQSLKNLVFLDLSSNDFGGDIQENFGNLTQVKYLVLHGNSFTGGINTSGILKLPNISRLDLSYNKFSGPLPVEISQMLSLEFLILAYNQFTGNVPPEYGNLPRLQALDLSYNQLTGSIPTSFGKLNSLLWLMLADNMLTGEIPKELGNCSSLLWLNLANNRLSGQIPLELTSIGANASSTFKTNRQAGQFGAGSGECLTMRRWIPANYPPFSFVYMILTTRSCRTIWDRLLKGHGLFPICSPGTAVSSLEVSGYVQLSGNQLSGEVPSSIGKMQNFSLLHFGCNQFHGLLPMEVSQLPLVVLNISHNRFFGEIPPEIGTIKCLQNLDLSYNNFSGTFPLSLNNLTLLSKFDVSYNPLLSGEIPSTGQLATFEKESYLGDPFLRLPDFLNSTPSKPPENPKFHGRKVKPRSLPSALEWFGLSLAFLFCSFSLVFCFSMKGQEETPGYLSEDTKHLKEFASSSSYSSPGFSDSIKVIRLDRTAFTHTDILKATGNFSEERVIGKGGFGTVYRGVLPDGRQVAVKRLQREGTDGEREFRAEMAVLSGNGFGWPHPNLVNLYGWCLDGSQKILVYEFMDGGSLEDLISDRQRLTWKRRIEVAIDVARALLFLHHECFPAIVHRDVKASNVLLDKAGKARVTDFGLARVVNAGDSHVSTMVAGTVGYVAPEYGQTWKATTKGDVYSFGVLTMELATGRRALDGGEECLVEWARRVMGIRRNEPTRPVAPAVLLGPGLVEGAEEMCELLRIGVKCTAESPAARPNMKEVLGMLIKVHSPGGNFNCLSYPPSF